VQWAAAIQKRFAIQNKNTFPNKRANGLERDKQAPPLLTNGPKVFSLGVSKPHTALQSPPHIA
jgi:hypothetical protein